MLATILSLAAEGGEEAAETVNPVLPTGPELFWGALFFAALWILMRYVLLPPVRAVKTAGRKKETGEISAHPLDAFNKIIQHHGERDRALGNRCVTLHGGLACVGNPA